MKTRVHEEKSFIKVGWPPSLSSPAPSVDLIGWQYLSNRWPAQPMRASFRLLQPHYRTPTQNSPKFHSGNCLGWIEFSSQGHSTPYYYHLCLFKGQEVARRDPVLHVGSLPSTRVSPSDTVNFIFHESIKLRTSTSIRKHIILVSENQ